MPGYPYKDIPLTPNVARGHILEYLSTRSTPVKRDDIAKYVIDQHRKLGGKIEGDPTPRVKKALRVLKDDGAIIHHTTGYYSLRIDRQQSKSDPTTSFSVTGQQGIGTTIAIDHDVLEAARAIARQKNQSIGRVVSELARKALRPRPAVAERNGVPLLPVRKPAVVVTLEIVNALRDELP
jgi:hypothetical protein